MGLMEVVLTTLATLCFNSTCVDQDLINASKQRWAHLKEELKQETLTVTTLKNGPLSGYEIVNNTVIGTGVAFEILNIVQREYGFKYNVIVPDHDSFEPVNGGEGGVRNMLLNETIDVAVAFLPQQYTDVVSYSRSLDTAQWVVLMKRPKESASGSGLLAPFTATVWSFIIISLLGVGPILWLTILLRARMCKEDHDIVFSLPACMWFVYGALLKQGSTLNPRTDSSRILFSTWWIFITILTAFYTANLTAFLTLSKFTLPISEPKDISRKHNKWITNRGNGIVEQLYLSKKYANGDGNSLFEQIGMPQWEPDVDEDTMLSTYVIKQNMMYIREKTVLESIMYEDYKVKTKADVEESKRCTYVITKFAVCVFPRAFAFRPGFKYKELFDLTIQHLSESGITHFKQRKSLPDTTICPLDLGSKERRLRNSDLAMTYMIVGGGLIISTIIFAVELIIYYVKMHCCNKKTLINNNNTLVAQSNNGLFVKNHQHNGNFRASKQFVSPPPSYHTLFHPPNLTNREYKNKTINGRQYWVFNDKHGMTSLIPQRTPSALLFQFTN